MGREYDLVKILGQNMKIVRAMKGISQRDLGEKIGLSSQYLSRLESGDMNPTLISVEKIADGLGVGVTTLLNEYRLKGLWSDILKEDIK